MANQGAMDQEFVQNEEIASIQDQIDREIAIIKTRFNDFNDQSPWILERRAANDAVSVRVFRRLLCGGLTRRRARRTVARIISDPSIMHHTRLESEHV